MYAGHFAAALALKAAKPETPTWALVAGSGALDVAFGVLVACGVEGFAPDFNTSHILLIPWSHSLAGACMIGVVFAAAFWSRGFGVMGAVFAAVLSHWALDVLVHRPDMAFWPNAPLRFGYSDLFGPVSGWAESAIVLVCMALYAARAMRAPGYGRHWGGVCAVVGATWVMGLASG